MKCIKYLVFLCLLATSLSKAQVSVFGKVDHIIPDGVDTQGNITLTVSGSTAPYTYTWNPGAIYTKDISNITAGQYTVDVKSASSQTINCIYSLGYKVLWANFDRCYFRNDSLVSTAATANAYGFATSRNTLAANTNGWFEYVVDNISITNPFFVGFVDSVHAIPSSYIDMDYAIYRTTTPTTINYYEAGVNNVLKTGLKVGDVVRIERRSDSIIYKVNNVTLRTVVSSGVGSKVFKLKANLRYTNRILNVGCSFSKLDSTSMANYIRVLPVIKHASDLGSSNGSIKAIPKYPFANTYTWQPGSTTAQTATALAVGVHTLTIMDSLANSTSYKYNIGYKVDWTNMDRCYFRNDSLVSPTVNASIYATAISKNTLPANTNGWFEYVIDNLGTNNYLIGFSDEAESIQYRSADIDFGFYYIASAKSFSYCESATYGALNHTPVAGDVMRIERTDSTIRYKINGITLSHSVTATGLKQKELKLKVMMLSDNKLVNVGCSFYNKSNAVWNDYVQVYPLIKHNSDVGASDGSIKLTPKIPFANTYSWTPGGATTASVSSLSPGNYSVTVKDSLQNETPYNYNVGYKVKWTNLERCVFRNDSLFSTTNNANIIATATSKNTLEANTDGWFEYVFDAAAANNSYIGFLDSVMHYPYSYGDLDYGLVCNGTSLSYYETGGTSTAVMTNHLRVGDIIRVQRVGDVISYKVNGYNFRTITVTGISQKVWKLKTNLVSLGRFVNVGCSFSKNDHVDFANYVQINAKITHNTVLGNNDGIIKVTPKIPFSNTYTWLPGGATTGTITDVPVGTSTLTIADSLSNKSRFKINMGYKPNWTGLSNASTSGDTLKGNVTTNASAYTKDTLLPYTDGWVEYVYSEPTAKSFYFGFLDAVGSATVATDIDYGFYFNGSTVINTYSGGTSTAWTYNFKPGDVVKMARFGDTIQYSLNGRLARVVVATGISSKAYRVKALLVNRAKLIDLGLSFTVCRAITSAGSSQTITCSSPSVTLTGSTSYTSGVTYSWTPGGSSPTSYTTQASTVGTYTLKMTYTNGCVYTPTVAVIGNTAAPTVTIESSNATPTLGLNAYWPFTGNANDKSGNGNNGTVTSAGLTADRFGNANRAYEFNGTTSRIDVPNSSTVDMPNGQDYSISFWMKSKSGNVDAIPLSKNEYGAWSGYMFFANSTNGGYCNTPGHGSFYLAAGGGGDACSDIPFCNDTTSWYFVTGQYNATTNQVFMYVNGILQGDVGTASGPTSNTRPLSFGAYNDAAGIGYYKGALDDIRMYNRMLTQSEIDALYHEPNPLSNPVALTDVYPTAILKAVSNITTLTYTWSPGGTTPNSSTTEVSSGATYTLAVTDTLTGCVSTNTILVVDTLWATATIYDYESEAVKGKVVLNITGGVPPYRTFWNGMKIPLPAVAYKLLKDSLPTLVIDSVAFTHHIDSLRKRTLFDELNPGTHMFEIYDQNNSSIIISASVDSKIHSWVASTGVTTSTNSINNFHVGNIGFYYGNGISITQTGTFTPGGSYAIPATNFNISDVNEMSFVIPDNTDIACVGILENNLELNGDITEMNQRTLFRFNGDGTYTIIFKGQNIFSGDFSSGDHFSLSTNTTEGKISYFKNELPLTEADLSLINYGFEFTPKIILGNSGAVVSGLKIKYPFEIIPMLLPPFNKCMLQTLFYSVNASASPNPVCSGSTTNLTGSLVNVLSSTPVSLPSGNYLWKPVAITGPGPVPVTPTSSQIYTLEVTYAAGCILKKSLLVTVNGLAANAGPDAFVLSGTNVVLGGTPSAYAGSGNYSYNWTPSATYVPNSNAANPTINATSNVVYTLTVTDNTTGCIKTDDKLVYLITEPYYFVLRKVLDAEYYNSYNNKIYFTFEEEYFDTSTSLNYKVVTDKNVEVTSLTSQTEHIGDNRFQLSISGLTPGEFYRISITNKKNEVFYARFKY